jgi:cholest-4-en-3-one 26-monooxygenase
VSTNVADLSLDQINIAKHDAYLNGVPHEQFEFLRREAPVFLHGRGEPDQPEKFWVVTRHADVVRVSRVFEMFSSAKNGCILAERREDLDIARMIIDLDPPEHTRLRGLVARAFTPRAVKTLDGHYREVTEKIIGERVNGPTFDVVTEVSAELPLIAIAELMGVPVGDRKKLFDWSNSMIGSNDPEYAESAEAGGNAMAELYMYANELAAARRLDPKQDIITTLLTAEGGDALTEHEFDMFVLLLAVAGNETTRNAISHGVLAFIDHPEQWQLLRSNPALLDNAVEEILRWATPVMQFMRTATVGLELHGQHIAEGDPVVMYYSSANRDEEVFPEPFKFDITRSPNPHVAFGGGGPHFCLGAQLARLEMRIMFEEMVRQVERIELDGPVERLRSNFIHGLKHLPIRFVTS